MRTTEGRKDRPARVRHPFRRAAAVGLCFGLLSTALPACVATVEERPPRVVYVAGPPPPPLVDAHGAPAAPGMIWVEGYWHWNGVQYVWIPGHWESPPPGFVWVAPRYTAVEGRHAYQAGHWTRRPVPP